MVMPGAVLVEPVSARRRAETERGDRTRSSADLAEAPSADIGLDHRVRSGRAGALGSGRRARTADLVDGSFVDMPLVVAARRRRLPQELIEWTPADGQSAIARGHATIAMSYDYTPPQAQGLWNHQKKDRLVSRQRVRLPVVIFTEGGGGPATPTPPVWRASTASPSTCSRK